MAAAMLKPCRLELNNSGSWKLLGTFDAADETLADLVLEAAEHLTSRLHNNPDPKRCPTMRVSMTNNPTGDTVDVVLLRWEITRGWYDAVTGKPA